MVDVCGHVVDDMVTCWTCEGDLEDTLWTYGDIWETSFEIIPVLT